MSTKKSNRPKASELERLATEIHLSLIESGNDDACEKFYKFMDLLDMLGDYKMYSARELAIKRIKFNLVVQQLLTI